MKVGDLVKTFQDSRGGGRIGVVVRLFEKKIWRTDRLGKQINWNKIEPEPVADVLVGKRVVALPLTDLEVISAAAD